MMKIIEIAINQIRVDDQKLAGTHLIVLPLDWMQTYRLLAGMNVLLHLPDGLELFLTVGAPLGQQENNAAIRIDPAYGFIYKYGLFARISIIKNPNRQNVQQQKVTLLMNQENAFAKILQWLEKRSGVNSCVQYCVGEEVKCVFVIEGINKIGAIRPKVESYYIVRCFDQWHDEWNNYFKTMQDEQRKRKKMLKLHWHRYWLSDKIDQLQKQIGEKLDNLEKKRDLLKALLGLNSFDFANTGRTLKKIKEEISRRGKDIEKFFVAGEENVLPEGNNPTIDDQINRWRKELQEFDSIFRQQKEPEQSFVVEMYQPLPDTSVLDEQILKLQKRLHQLTERVKQATENKNKLRDREVKWSAALENEILPTMEKLEKEIQVNAANLQKALQELADLVGKSGYFPNKIQNLKKLLSELLNVPHSSSIQVSGLKIWNELVGIETGVAQLEKIVADKLRKEKTERVKF